MAVLEILKFPDIRLRTKATPVVEITSELLKIVDDMYETMYHAKGVGLAGTQVNIHQQIFVMDVSENNNERICVFNPAIISKEGEVYEDEGCLSVIGGFDKVKRAAKVHLRGMDIHGKPLEIEADGLMAICIQHEIDHLNGILFIDHLSRLKQERLRKKIAKAKRE